MSTDSVSGMYIRKLLSACYLSVVCGVCVCVCGCVCVHACAVFLCVVCGMCVCVQECVTVSTHAWRKDTTKRFVASRVQPPSWKLK